MTWVRLPAEEKKFSHPNCCGIYEGWYNRKSYHVRTGHSDCSCLRRTNVLTKQTWNSWTYHVTCFRSRIEYLGKTGERSLITRIWNECQHCTKRAYNQKKKKPPSRLYADISLSHVFRRKSSSYLGRNTRYPDWGLFNVCLRIFRKMPKS